MKSLNIIGLGYIGLPTALMFSANNVDVIGTDLNTNLVETLNNGKLTFEENGLEDLYEKAVRSGIKFSDKYVETDKYIITVPTPYIEENKKIDPSYVIKAVNTVLETCKIPSIVVIESTVSPGTIDKHIRPLVEEKGLVIGEDIHLVHAPERIIPGNMVYELEHNSRTIGADDRSIGEEVKSWYKNFCKGEIVVTDIKTAEMSKVVENTFRDINIAFANELAKICRSEGMDVYELIRIANKHPRVNILQPGPGVGGHCISVDPWFLVGDYPEIVHTILSARVVNDSMPKYVLERIQNIMNENNIDSFKKVGLYGMTYKENIDDMRESPTLQLMDLMQQNHIEGVKIYDPWIKDKKFENQFNNFETFINDVEIVVILVAHSHIKENINLLKNKIIYDTRNILDIDKKVYKL
ncbi:nucleotide sugar dehydrogenase [Paraclostridium bifermentans]|uniref:nucleotide sugar dehydrogenase n=1 Tax=Paraclostridium TaxID=1849822 RepID=UPI001CC54B55|nr:MULTISPECIES: nucleotide sugar dehydrogenase [Paraclostridium]MBZ6006061.1 nucleotide sugar dehydrogenase [Paraclostridium bifermentans]MDU0298453.1 nucleotide sugar dehydrogenase [Paraclostridium sp. MRS3W1]